MKKGEKLKMELLEFIPTNNDNSDSALTNARMKNRYKFLLLVLIVMILFIQLCSSILTNDDFRKVISKLSNLTQF